MNATISKKRLSPTPLESIAMDCASLKKPRTDAPSAISFPTVTEDAPVELQQSYPVEFNFGELAHEFVSTPVPGNDLNANAFDSLFSDIPLNIVPVNYVSDVSDEEKPVTVKAESQVVPSSPLSSENNAEKSDATNSSSQNDDSNQKRQADRAARNRESSRRAREKAKSRLRSLEADNMALRDMVRRFKMQNDHLLSQLERTNAIQQSCTMCRYNAAMVQQPTCQAQQAAVARQ